MTVRVFLVEDMPQVQGLLAELLAGIGDFDFAGAATTEAEARLWLVENPGAWDLAIIDLVLEQGSGMGVIPHARAAAGDAAASLVVFSDYATEGIRQHCRKLGADAVFRKTDEMQDFMAFCAGLEGSAAAPAA
ncbi:MAG TPA: hypothetical protein VIL30_09760 [Ramlibacter sp.]